MIRKEASPEVLEKIKTFERKQPRTIFYDQQTSNFLYLNPYHGDFQKCGEWSVNRNI